jgi:cysteinyl-tRNA synthetase
VSRQSAPAGVRALANARSAARAARDWIEADRLRAEIEAAGWKVVDRGVDFVLEPAHAPDMVEGGRIRYGSSTSVPSRLADPPVGLASILLVATDWPADLARALVALDAHAPGGTQVVVVANGPSPEQEQALDRLEQEAPVGEARPEIVWTSDRLGHASAVNTGIRRAGAGIVILLDTGVEPTGDCITPLVRALEDPSVGLAGAWGLVTDDLRHFHETDRTEVDAIEAYCLAFRREDFVERGPLDEHFRFYRNLDVWWSLVLRDEGPDRPPRRAIRLDGLPLVRHEHREWSALAPEERDRLSKRNFYRVIRRFGARRDLIANRSPAAT